MDERIRQLRRKLDMTQQEFADRIGLKRNTIANYETGRNEPVSSVINLICREFGVSEKWLRTGQGEMFAVSPSNELDALAKKEHLTVSDYIFLEKFLKMSANDRKVIVDYILETALAILPNYESRFEPAAPSGEETRIDIDAEVEAYRRSLELQEKAAGKSSASSGQDAGGVG